MYEGHLYSCKHGAYSIVVAAETATHARDVFQAWISQRHGVSVDPRSIAHPRSTRTLGDRPLVIAEESA